MIEQEVRLGRSRAEAKNRCRGLARKKRHAETEAQEAVSSVSGFWQRRIVAPILLQLRQGMTPEKIALTLALGSTIATFPILGSTSILSVLVALILRLNQPIMLLTGWLFYPIQFLLLLPLYRAGEYLGAPHLALSLPQMIARFRSSPSQFINDFSGIALGGVGVWCLLAPPAITILYFVTRSALRALALRAARGSTDTSQKLDGGPDPESVRGKNDSAVA